MRLINTTTLELEQFIGSDVPDYAILSHTWEPDGEVSFEDFKDRQARSQMKGFAKIEHTCALAKDLGLRYAWVDTCCINKDSSAELSEAINSMFQWYAKSSVCFAYLSDLEPAGRHDVFTVGACRWFTRGWTLQELIAPRKVCLYDKNWSLAGDKHLHPMDRMISDITGIDEDVLRNLTDVLSVPVYVRMSWACRRMTTRTEDTAYCLLGIFDVNMPMLYGEGSKAFQRLQEEIARGSTDMSLFTWQRREENATLVGLFARSPADFSRIDKVSMLDDHRLNEEFVATNKGLRINCALGSPDGQNDDIQILPLSCSMSFAMPFSGIGIYVQAHGPNMFARMFPDTIAIGNWNFRGTNNQATPSTRYISTKIEQVAVSATKQQTLNFKSLSTNGDVTPVAPLDRWSNSWRSWIIWKSGDTRTFACLSSYTSREFSGAIYILVERHPGQPTPQVKLLNDILLAKLRIATRRERTTKPPLLMAQTLHKAAVFSPTDPERAFGLLSVSVCPRNYSEREYEIKLSLDRSCWGSLPSRADYIRQVNIESGQATELTLPRQPAQPPQPPQSAPQRRGLVLLKIVQGRNR